MSLTYLKHLSSLWFIYLSHMSYVGVNWQVLSEHVFVCQSEKIFHWMPADWLVFTTTQDLSTYHFIVEKIEGKGVKKRRNEGGGLRRGARREGKWESERIWGEGAMKLVTGVPVTCQQLVLAARAGKACMRSVYVYMCVGVCEWWVQSVCMWQYGPSPSGSFFLLPYWTGRTESCAQF